MQFTGPSDFSPWFNDIQVQVYARDSIGNGGGLVSDCMDLGHLFFDLAEASFKPMPASRMYVCI
jgi:hypothetical protein